jgi:electron transfer flavoprotein alpha subunit
LADDLARYLPRVLAVNVASAAGMVTAAAVAPALAQLIAREQPAYVLVGATSDGRDLAGMLSVLLGWGVLVNAGAIVWAEGRPAVEMAVFGGRLLTTSELTDDHGIITVRPNSVTAEELDSPGSIEAVDGSAATPLSAVAVTDRIVAASTAIPIEDAQVIVAGGRGVGSREGFGVLQELADVLGGSVGATRAAVDAGWIDFSQQIGQTGKTVKPHLYVALGISGAIQHTVGITGAEAIIAVNRDMEAPIVAFADLVVVGDLFQIAPAIIAELKARTG